MPTGDGQTLALASGGDVDAQARLAAEAMASGDLHTACAIWESLRRRHPDLPVLLTALATAAGTGHEAALAGWAEALWSPLDDGPEAGVFLAESALADQRFRVARVLIRSAHTARLRGRLAPDFAARALAVDAAVDGQRAAAASVVRTIACVNCKAVQHYVPAPLWTSLPPWAGPELAQAEAYDIAVLPARLLCPDGPRGRGFAFWLADALSVHHGLRAATLVTHVPSDPGLRGRLRPEAGADLAGRLRKPAHVVVVDPLIGLERGDAELQLSWPDGSRRRLQLHPGRLAEAAQMIAEALDRPAAVVPRTDHESLIALLPAWDAVGHAVLAGRGTVPDDEALGERPALEAAAHHLGHPTLSDSALRLLVSACLAEAHRHSTLADDFVDVLVAAERDLPAGDPLRPALRRNLAWLLSQA